MQGPASIPQPWMDPSVRHCQLVGKGTSDATEPPQRPYILPPPTPQLHHGQWITPPLEWWTESRRLLRTLSSRMTPSGAMSNTRATAAAVLLVAVAVRASTALHLTCVLSMWPSLHAP